MAVSIGKRPMDIGKKGTWAQQEDEDLHPNNAQFKEGMKCKEHEPKSPRILHATRDKHQLGRTAESSKHGGNKNGVKAKQKQIQMKWSMRKRMIKKWAGIIEALASKSTGNKK